MFTGPAILGIKEVSRVSEFGSSYTLIEHASEDALQFEIMLCALKRIGKLKKAWDEGDYQTLFEIIGKSEIVANDDDASFDPESLEREQEPASEGWDPAEAVLLADHSGNAIKFPYVFNQLNRKLARWVFRTCTGGDLKLPAFALADDGVLIEHRGKIISASDWIPEDTSITSLTAEKGLCVRYPIRMQEDLLPVRHLTNNEFVPMLKQALGVEDGHQLPTQCPVLLSPQFQGKEAIMSAKDWFRCNLRTRSPRLQRQRVQGYGQLAGMDHA
jgi:hypothetical protein